MTSVVGRWQESATERARGLSPSAAETHLQSWQALQRVRKALGPAVPQPPAVRVRLPVAAHWRVVYVVAQKLPGGASLARMAPLVVALVVSLLPLPLARRQV